MASIAVIVGSPAPASRSLAFGHLIGRQLGEVGLTSEVINLRDLPPAALVLGQADAPELAEVAGTIAGADGVVLITPVYKAAYTGLLKSVLDVLPQSAL